jgi:hypothetical protein
VHAAPLARQKESEVQAPAAQFAEQHSASVAHAELSALHAGVAHWWLVPLQNPEQQSASRAHVPLFPKHVPAGATHSPFAH